MWECIIHGGAYTHAQFVDARTRAFVGVPTCLLRHGYYQRLDRFDHIACVWVRARTLGRAR